jgi:hypothetical protein
MVNLTYEGRVTVYDTKADGTKLIIGKGDRKGEPYYKLSFKVGGEYVNLMDFDGVTGGNSGSYIVEYYQKFHPNGEPDLYNDKPQYQMVDIAPLGATQTALPAPAGASASPTIDRDESIRSQTSLKVAGELYASEIVVTSTPFDAGRFAEIYDGVKGKLDFGAFTSRAKAALDTTPADADDKPDPDGSEGDDDIPF